MMTSILPPKNPEMMPSVVCFRDKGTTLVGNKALNMAMIRPESTILSVKRNIGKAGFAYNVGGASHSPEELTSDEDIALAVDALTETLRRLTSGEAAIG